jgi:hypothetical protein
MHVMKSLPLSLFVLLGFGAPAMANITVQNGSLENLNGTFVNTTCNYMALGNGSTTIPDWTVSTTSGPIVWAQSPTCDGYTAADGAYFVDLSGFGNSSPDGALNQSLSTVGGVNYTFSMDVWIGERRNDFRLGRRSNIGAHGGHTLYRQRHLVDSGDRHIHRRSARHDSAPHRHGRNARLVG